MAGLLVEEMDCGSSAKDVEVELVSEVLEWVDCRGASGRAPWRYPWAWYCVLCGGVEQRLGSCTHLAAVSLTSYIDPSMVILALAFCCSVIPPNSVATGAVL
jgi:hypothetical protein